MYVNTAMCNDGRGGQHTCVELNQKQYIIKILVLVYKGINGTGPEYMHELLTLQEGEPLPVCETLHLCHLETLIHWKVSNLAETIFICNYIYQIDVNYTCSFISYCGVYHLDFEVICPYVIKCSGSPLINYFLS